MEGNDAMITVDQFIEELLGDGGGPIRYSETLLKEDYSTDFLVEVFTKLKEREGISNIIPTIFRYFAFFVQSIDDPRRFLLKGEKLKDVVDSYPFTNLRAENGKRRKEGEEWLKTNPSTFIDSYDDSGFYVWIKPGDKMSGRDVLTVCDLDQVRRYYREKGEKWKKYFKKVYVTFPHLFSFNPIPATDQRVCWEKAYILVDKVEEVKVKEERLWRKN